MNSRKLKLVTTTLAVVGWTMSARAEGSHFITRCTLEGASRTAEATVCELLPRGLPATYASGDLVEYERRLSNLRIFDQVTVNATGSTLVVQAREKWSLIPSLEFSSARTFKDTYFLLGLTEYNALGTANQVGLS